MFRVNKPLAALSRFAASKLSRTNTLTAMSPALVVTSMRTAAGGTKGAPPISIDDLYGLCFLAEPTVRPPVEREPREMFDGDIRINEVVVFLNGGLHATNDKVNEDFVLHMFGANVIFFPRDASNKPQEFRDILKSEGGSEELPQLWIRGKCVGSGQELKDFDRVWELCTPCRVAYPRTGPKGAYQQGFYDAQGVTQSDKIIGAGAVDFKFDGPYKSVGGASVVG